MVFPQIPLPALDWSKDNKQTAFQEWKELLESYFVINKVKDADKHHYLLLSSSPYYPQSNGFIERVVQTIKTTLKIYKSSKSDPQLALLALRFTPLDTYLPSPTEILFGRRIQGTLPSRKQ
ncbi:hypothetical protein PoB_001736300 [Plakobranchus ocellatus]|uniref:Integrase catalytic domain-containing protein n=1 Tax=Plakobranchus ocellatus TaxID=259542 RepID=A0AAV3Z7Z8_9GAST|nr:hypothetical protein PoB_001736300 [Plakobranchus ocellatus]